MDTEKIFAQLTQLAPGWDGRDAIPPNARAVSRARMVERALGGLELVPQQILPSEDGGIGFVFVNGDRYADIECFNTGRIGAIMRRGFREPTIWWPQLSSLDRTIERIKVFLFASGTR